MAETIARAVSIDTSELPRLAIVPFQLRDSTSESDADVLAQILAINIVRSGAYAVYPRTASLEQVQDEYANQLSGDTEDESLVDMGKGENPQFVLSGTARKLGSVQNMFNTSIIDLRSGVQKKGASVNYESLDDGIDAMLALVRGLTGVSLSAPASVAAASEGFVRIQGGTFTMGSPASEAGRYDNEVQHQVTVGSFYMGKYEVTQKEYQALMGTNPSYFKGDNLPVEQVTWYDAVNYCNALSRKEGLTPAYTVSGTNVSWNRSANGYRLPTEAEWEYACRAGTTTPYSSGSSVDGAGWYSSNSASTTQPVGTKQANAWSLYDMHGNVWEWCWDWYGAYPSDAQTDPMGASSGSPRVLRGGSWSDIGRIVRSAYRLSYTPSYRISFLGVRLLRPSL
jgi:formylglycine-generating enzyme required for sulfatase activity